MLFCNDSVDANRVLDCCFSSLYILVVAAAAIEQKCKKKDLGYAEVMEEATRLGPKCVQKCSGGMSIQLGRQGRKEMHLQIKNYRYCNPGPVITYPASRSFVNGLILCMQFGCCCVYVVFNADNVKEVFNEEFALTWSNKVYICILSPMFLLLSAVRNINLLAKFSGEFSEDDIDSLIGLNAEAGLI